MKKTFAAVSLFSILMAAPVAKSETIVPITSFEEYAEGIDWAYSGNSILFSFVDFAPLPDDIVPVDGDHALFVEYDTSPGGWEWAQLTFPIDPIDLTGMRELRMSMYVMPGSQPNPDNNQINIRLDLPGGVSLGTVGTDVVGEWVELVWKIDRLTSDNDIASVGNFGGFVLPGAQGLSGSFYLDNIYAVRPADVIDVETIQVWGFNETNPDDDAPLGWQNNDGNPPLLGIGDVQPSEGDNYMEIFLGSGWVNTVGTASALDDFDRWHEVLEILIDARTSQAFAGGWLNLEIVLQSGGSDEEGVAFERVNGWDAYATRDIVNAVDEWRTLLWEVDMSRHMDALTREGGWFSVNIVTNNDGSEAGKTIYIDNFRVAVPVDGVSVDEWAIY